MKAQDFIISALLGLFEFNDAGEIDENNFIDIERSVLPKRLLAKMKSDETNLFNDGSSKGRYYTLCALYRKKENINYKNTAFINDEKKKEDPVKKIKGESLEQFISDNIEADCFLHEFILRAKDSKERARVRRITYLFLPQDKKISAEKNKVTSSLKF